MTKIDAPQKISQKSIETLEQNIEKYHTLYDSMEPDVRKEFCNLLDTTWCYHEFGVEGIVLDHLEIKSALDDRIVSHSSLINHYDEVIAFYKGITKIKADASKQRLVLTINTLKELHKIITVETDSKAFAYRKEIPLHRQYLHDFAQPEKIPYQMRKLSKWFQSSEFRKLSPIIKAANIHNQLIGIFPWPNNSGMLARLVMNLILMQANYPPIIIRATQRQEYYDYINNDLHQDTEIRMSGFLAEILNLYLTSVFKKFKVTN